MFLGLWHPGKPKPLRFSSLRDKMNINKCNELPLKPFLCCLSLAANVCVCGGAASSCRLHGGSCSQCFHASSARRIQLGRRIQAPSVLQSSGFDVVMWTGDRLLQPSRSVSKRRGLHQESSKHTHSYSVDYSLNNTGKKGLCMKSQQ